MGIEKNLAEVGKVVAYNAVPQLDNAAAAALRYGERGLDPAISAFGTVWRAGSFALDVINPQREDERAMHQHFKKHTGRIVLVGGYEDMEPAAADRTADSLWQSGLVDAGTIVGVRPLVHREPTKRQLELHQSAELLHTSLVSKYDVASILISPEDPARVPGRRLKVAALHETIYRANDEWGTWIHDKLSEHPSRDDDVRPRVRTLVVVSPELPINMQDVRYEDVANGGLVVLAEARKHAKHRWVALKRAPLAPPEPTEDMPTIDLPAEAPQVELDFPVTRGPRFVRGDDLQPVDQRARDRRIALSE